jgi:hypothetical protein
MLAILVSVQCDRLLVIVPTDALRTQIANAFLTLGVLKHPRSKLLRSSARYPIVCSLEHIPRTAPEVDDIFSRAQVVVTTSAIAGQCKVAVQARMAELCPYLFIDEAHHAEAPTWSSFKDQFRNRRVVQFTATPFREDGKPLDGQIIYRYSLRKAQEDGYFKPIRFEPVVAFTQKKADAAIVKKAIAQLRADSAQGHILMARVDSLSRAEEVLKLYAKYPEFNPVALHTGITSKREREALRQQVLSGASRIVVCVDMLGEGFDLPELKIAAFHDIRKTLAVTLQLAGRFTRSRRDLGDATFIANTGDVNVREELRKLYSRDPDWNVLLPQLSDRMVGEQMALQTFLQGFSTFAEEIPIRTVRPANSIVVYRTRCEDWTPEQFREGLPGIDTCDQIHHTINASEHTLIIVTARRVIPSWTTAESLASWDWELYVAIWSPEQHLLFINGSTNSGERHLRMRSWEIPLPSLKATMCSAPSPASIDCDCKTSASPNSWASTSAIQAVWDQTSRQVCLTSVDEAPASPCCPARDMKVAKPRLSARRAKDEYGPIAAIASINWSPGARRSARSCLMRVSTPMKY